MIWQRGRRQRRRKTAKQFHRLKLGTILAGSQSHIAEGACKSGGT